MKSPTKTFPTENVKHIRICAAAAAVADVDVCHKCKLHSLANVRIVPNAKQQQQQQHPSKTCERIRCDFGFGFSHFRLLIFDVRKIHTITTSITTNATNSTKYMQSTNTHKQIPLTFFPASFIHSFHSVVVLYVFHSVYFYFIFFFSCWRCDCWLRKLNMHIARKIDHHQHRHHHYHQSPLEPPRKFCKHAKVRNEFHIKLDNTVSAYKFVCMKYSNVNKIGMYKYTRTQTQTHTHAHTSLSNPSWFLESLI